LIFSALCININAQKIGVRTMLDSTTMLIGEQSMLTFQIDQFPDIKVLMPVFSDTLPGGLEIVGQPTIDTTKANDGLISIRLQYTITAFEEAVYAVPELPFVDGEDTVFSNSVSIKIIQPFQIDTVTNTFADIKPVIKPPFNWKYFLTVTLLVVLSVGILVLLIFIFIKIILKKKVIMLNRPTIVIPPDVLALKELDKIREEKLLQSGHIKEYHTRIADTVRLYIERAFGINSMEMTSEEILNSLHNLKVDNINIFNELGQLLRTADLVKFAKHKPSVDENEFALAAAYNFVGSTTKTDFAEFETNDKETV
jgi:hypothetical protein